MMLQDNSLIAEINPISQPHTEHVIVVDSETAPTVGDGSWAPRVMDSQYTITGNVPAGTEWDAHTYYPWINDGATVSALLNADGGHGLVLKAKDTISSTTTTTAWTLAAGTDPSTDISVTLPIFSDAGSGVKQIDLWHWDITGSYTLYRSDISNAGTAQNLTGNSPGQALDLVPIAIDNAGNTKELPHKVITLGAAAAGTVNFSGYTAVDQNKIVTFTEDGGAQNVSLTCSGTHGAFTIDIHTVGGTAEGDIDYTSLPVGTTVTFGAGTDTTVTQAITIIDNTSPESNMFGVVMDDTQTGLGSVVLGPDTGINVLVEGSGGGTVGFQQDSTSDELLVIDVKNMTAVAGASDSIGIVADDRAYTDFKCRTSTGSDQGTTTEIGSHETTVSASGVARLEADVVWASNSPMYFWMRANRNSELAFNRIHLAIDNIGSNNVSPNAALLNADIAYALGSNEFHWMNTDEAGNQLTGTPAAAGAGKLHLCKYKENTKVGRIVVSKNASYNPNFSGVLDADGKDRHYTGDGYYGPAESEQLASGDPIDNPLNAVVPPTPASGGGSVTMTLSPIDNFTSAPVNVAPVISYPLGSEITNSEFTMRINSVLIPGTLMINAAGTSATFVPNAPYDNSTTQGSVTIVAVGTVRDENGDIKDYATTVTSWNFTIQVSPIIGGDYILEETFNNLPVDTLWGLVAKSRIEAQGSSIQSSTIGTKCLIFDDPLGDPARGRVMGVYAPEGTTGVGPDGYGLCEMQIILPATYTTLYFSYEWMQMANDPNTGFPTEDKILTKMPGLAGSNPTNLLGLASGGNQPTGVVPSAWSARCQRMRFDSFPNFKQGYVGYLYGADPDQDPSTDTGHGSSDYYYNQKVVQAYNDGSDPLSGKLELPRDQWHRIECKIVINTANPGGLPVANGVFELYINGVYRGGRSNVPWRVDSIPINMVFFATGYGGDASNPLYYPTNPQYTYYDNLIVSETPITF
jgi:hypothetical protein